MTSPAGGALPAWAIRLTAELDAAEERAKKLVTGLTPEQLNWQPGLNMWSVGQCLEHLCRMKEVYLPAISSALLGKPSSVVPDITPGWFGRWLIRSYVEPSQHEACLCTEDDCAWRASRIFGSGSLSSKQSSGPRTSS